MPVYTDWFSPRFKACKRFKDSSTSIIDFYVKEAIPCELITSESPLAIRYENGIELGNVVNAQTDAEVSLYLWWRQTIGSEYSLSLQVFDHNREKVSQSDAEISGEPIDTFTFDLSTLAPGDYSVELIVYNFETRQSVPGILVNSQQGFDRSVSIANVAIADRS